MNSVELMMLSDLLEKFKEGLVNENRFEFYRHSYSQVYYEVLSEFRETRYKEQNQEGTV